MTKTVEICSAVQTTYPPKIGLEIPDGGLPILVGGGGLLDGAEKR